MKKGKLLLVIVIILIVLAIGVVLLNNQQNSTSQKIQSEYIMTEEEAKLLIKKTLKSKYDNEFIIDTIYADSNIYSFHGYIATVKLSDDKISTTFDVTISKEGKVLDNYYDFLIDDEYKELILENISKIDNKAKIIEFSNNYRHPYGDEVNKDLSLKEALLKKVISKYLNIITYTDLSDNNVKQIEEVLKDIHYRGHVTIYQTDKKTYSEVNSLSIYSEGQSSLNPKLEKAQEYKFDIYD